MSLCIAACCLASRMAQTLVSKQAVIDKALDKGAVTTGEAQAAPVMPSEVPVEQAADTVDVAADAFSNTKAAKDEPATKSLTFESVAAEAKKLAPEQVKAIHQGLQMLAGMDADHASIKNEMGFNAFDGKIGHSLAYSPFLTPKQAVLGQKILLKYKKQLGADLHAAIKGAA